MNTGDLTTAIQDRVNGLKDGIAQGREGASRRWDHYRQQSAITQEAAVDRSLRDILNQVREQQIKPADTEELASNARLPAQIRKNNSPLIS